MRGYRINDLDSTTRQLIRDKNLDKNGDELINVDNGELAELLSQTGKNNIDELGRDLIFIDKPETFFGAIGTFACAAGLSKNVGVIHDIFYNQKVKNLSEQYDGFKAQIKPIDIPYTPPYNSKDFKLSEALAKSTMKKYNAESNSFMDKMLKNDLAKMRTANEEYDKKYKIKVSEIKLHNEKITESMNKTLKKIESTKMLGKSLKGFFIMGTLALLGTSVAIATRKTHLTPTLVYVRSSQPVQNENETVQNPDLKTKFEEGFKELGISNDTQLKEYTPQKGEYWISILKAKYGVDDETAERMSHRIKDVIYDDSLAAKQSPVMYLPQTWTFEGKTYKYNDNTKADKTDKYSDDVKTDMGKMNKNIKYNK